MKTQQNKCTNNGEEKKNTSRSTHMNVSELIGFMRLNECVEPLGFRLKIECIISHHTLKGELMACSPNSLCQRNQKNIGDLFLWHREWMRSTYARPKDLASLEIISQHSMIIWESCDIHRSTSCFKCSRLIKPRQRVYSYSAGMGILKGLNGGVGCGRSTKVDRCRLLTQLLFKSIGIVLGRGLGPKFIFIVTRQHHCCFPVSNMTNNDVNCCHYPISAPSFDAFITICTTALSVSLIFDFSSLLSL